jgi:hypothetical protein
MEIQCLYSGEGFNPIRSNQKFASTKNRISYHNAKLKKIRDARASIDNKLHKNYLILLELMKDKTKGIFHKQFLKGKGYSFNVLTHYEEYKNKNRHAIYDFLIIEEVNGIQIVRH